MNGGSEPTKQRGRCALCQREFSLRRAGLNNRKVAPGALYVPRHLKPPTRLALDCPGSGGSPAPAGTIPIPPDLR